MQHTHHVISFSGGKDSTALVLLALEVADRKGFSPLVVFADTGNEHELTYEYVETVERHIGLKIQRVRADFSAQVLRKRNSVGRRWTEDRVPPHRIAKAVRLLQPTGIPFLDLCLWKGRAPSTKRRFCTEETKVVPIYEQVQLPLMRTGRVLSWQGVRAEESPARAALKRLEKGDGRLWHFRPLLCWSVEEVFAMHRRHGLEPNPLYKMGLSRVGCMPCIHSTKDEVRNISARFPHVIDRVAEWESLIGDCAKRRGLGAFFSSDKTPQGAADKSSPIPGIRDVVEWSKTSRGGRQYDLGAFLPSSSCSSVYGLCE